jgi:protein TonB
MDFTHANQGGRKSGKFVLVAALHVALGVMFVNGMNTRHISIFHEKDIEVTMPHEKFTPPKPIDPPKVETNLQPLKLIVPVVENVVVAPPEKTIIAEPGPAVVTPGATPGSGPVVAEQHPVAPPVRQTGMHTAVLADANACSLPTYPKAAIRNEETGTTTLALLVGTDGRVTSARVEQSSGFRDLDRAAVDALSLCQFKPATNNGAPEAGWAKLAYVWRLD